MKEVLIVLSGVVTIVAAVPYLIEILRGKAKPRIVSWFTWSLLTGIGCAAAFAEGQLASGVLLLCGTIEVLLIAILGFKHGDRKFEPLDIVCQIAALVGLLLWFVFNSPAIAVIAAVTIDLVGAIPTFKHSWLQPYEETWITYLLAGLGGGLTLLATTSWRITAVAYAAYILIVNLILAVIILASPHRHRPGEPSTLRRL